MTISSDILRYAGRQRHPSACPRCRRVPRSREGADGCARRLSDPRDGRSGALQDLRSGLPRCAVGLGWPVLRPGRRPPPIAASPDGTLVEAPDRRMFEPRPCSLGPRSRFRRVEPYRLVKEGRLEGLERLSPPASRIWKPSRVKRSSAILLSREPVIGITIYWLRRSDLYCAER